MANTRELRRRIKSIKNTSQITKAMQMVAATKMRRAQNQALSGRPYSETLNQALERLTPVIHPDVHPFLNPNGVNKIGIILLSTDKGLAGALNTNIFRALINFLSPRHPDPPVGGEGSKNFIFFTRGKKGRQFVVKTNKQLAADFENAEVVDFRQARQLAKLVIGSFLKQEIGQAFIIYPDFISTLRQEPRVVKLLPIESVILIPHRLVQEKDIYSSATPQNDKSEFLFEPNPDDLLEFVLTHYIETQIYQALLETKASEHSARMIAMQNATENAKELVEDLTLTYNQTRQESITRELLEITSASAALE